MCGGNLCAISAIHARDTHLPLPAGSILLSPWLDLTHDQTLDSPAMRTDFLITFNKANPMLVEQLLPEGMAASDPLISPTYGDLHSLPPQIVFVGGAEVLLPDSKDWVVKSRDAGNNVDYVVEPGQVHMSVVIPSVYVRSSHADTTILGTNWVVHSVTKAPKRRQISGCSSFWWKFVPETKRVP
jgi:monoterpene epsilon-lactone hydrolase